MSNSILPREVRCVLLVGAQPGIEGTARTRKTLVLEKGQSLSTKLAHYSIGFTVPEDALTDEQALARYLREFADMIEAPEIEDNETI